MTFRLLGCAVLATACLLMATRGLEAGPSADGGTKFGASGQAYVWQAGTC